MYPFKLQCSVLVRRKQGIFGIVQILSNLLKGNSPVNRPVDPKQIATEIINTPAFSL